MSLFECIGIITLLALAAVFIVAAIVFVCETCGLFKRVKDLEDTQYKLVPHDHLKLSLNWRDEDHNRLVARVANIAADQERMLAVVEALTNQQRSRAKK